MTKPKLNINNEETFLVPDYKRNDIETTIKDKMEGIERRLHNIESLLWENRDTYTSSLDIVANRELEIASTLLETKKLLKENREQYGQAFQRLFDKEELLIKLLNETTDMLRENRKIYTGMLQDVKQHEVKNSESLEKLAVSPVALAPNQMIKQIGVKNRKMVG